VIENFIKHVVTHEDIVFADQDLENAYKETQNSPRNDASSI
jgi:hypothetical protein